MRFPNIDMPFWSLSLNSEIIRSTHFEITLSVSSKNYIYKLLSLLKALFSCNYIGLSRK